MIELPNERNMFIWCFIMKNAKQSVLAVESGIFEMKGKRIKSFNEVYCPSIIQTLDLSNNQITDFYSFYPSFQLHSLVLDYNPLLSFENFPIEHNIETISLFHTPLSKHPHFRLLTLFALGKTLKKINNEPVTDEEYQFLSNEKLKSFFKIDDISLLSRFQTIVRNGYVGKIFPDSLEKAEIQTQKQQKFPLSMKIMNLVKIAKLTEKEKQLLFEEVFGNKVIKTIKTSPTKIIEEKLKKQLLLIDYLQNELEQLKQEMKEENKTIKTKPFLISEENEEKYQILLNNFASPLTENEIILTKINHQKEMLRKQAKSVLGIDNESLSDKELSQLLSRRFLT